MESTGLYSGIRGGGSRHLPHHSTPLKSSLSPPRPTTATLARPAGPGGDHTGATRPSTSPLRGSGARSPSPSPLLSSPTKQNSASDLETSTIQKQRKELQLLIAELQDRDRELNEMVRTHQKQLVAWEEDRQRVLTLRQKSSKLEDELNHKNQQIKSLATRLKVVESQEHSKTCALESTQKQLEQLSDKVSSSNFQLQEVEEKNQSLNSSLCEMSSQIGGLEAREQELVTLLKLKDKDLMEASAHIAELANKLKRMDQRYREIRNLEGNARKEAAEWKQKQIETKSELDKLKDQLNNSVTEQHIEVQRIKEDNEKLKNELQLSGEREKRKDQITELQKSKQERTDAELHNLRQIYERQQRDLSLLQLNLDSKNDLINRQEAKINQNLQDDLERSLSPQSPLHHRSRQSASSSPVLGIANLENGGLGNQDMSSGDTEDLLASFTLTNDIDASPTSKLHKLLVESREMVKIMEQAAGSGSTSRSKGETFES